MQFVIYYENGHLKCKDKKEDIFRNYFFTERQKQNLLNGKTVIKFGIKYKIKCGEVTKVGIVNK